MSDTGQRKAHGDLIKKRPAEAQDDDKDAKKGRWDSAPSLTVGSSSTTGGGSQPSSAAMVASQKAQERFNMLQQRQALQQKAGFVRMATQPHIASQMSASQLRAQMHAQSGYTGVMSSTSAASGMMPMKFDKLGRPLDDKGNVMAMMNPMAHSSLRINQKLVIEEQRKHREKKLEQALEQAKNPMANEFYDSSLVSKKSTPNYRGLSFNVGGTFVKKEASINAKKLGVKIDELLPANLKKSAPDDTPVSLKPTNLIPTIEPWDVDLFRSEGMGNVDTAIAALPEIPLGAKTRDMVVLHGLATMKDIPSDLEALHEWAENCKQMILPGIGPHINTKAVTSLEQHPIPIEPRGFSDRNTIDSKVYLTLKEQKKLRRLRRKEAEQEKRDKIRIGMLPTPAPKVKLANLHRVLAQESVQDPTAIEASVRAQMKQRLDDHEAHNKARQLTDEQKRDKKVKGWKEAKAQKSQVTVLLFSLPKVSRNTRYQISQNAEQLHLTGCMLHAEGTNRGICVVEGGPKSTRFFKRLMLRRIKWGGKSMAQVLEGDNEDDEEEDDLYGSAQKANMHDDDVLVQMNNLIEDPKRPQLVWEGFVDEKNGKKFSNWRAIDRPQTDNQIQNYFKNREALDYWQLVLKHRPVQEDLNQMLIE